MTDLSVTATAEGWEKIGAFTGDWGDTIWDARTIICTASGCYSSTPINENYNYAEIDFNTYHMNAYSWGDKTTVATHEFGHTFSLAHVPYCNPDDHIMFTPVLHSCNAIATYPQPHDVAGINALY